MAATSHACEPTSLVWRFIRYDALHRWLPTAHVSKKVKEYAYLIWFFFFGHYDITATYKKNQTFFFSSILHIFKQFCYISIGQFKFQCFLRIYLRLWQRKKINKNLQQQEAKIFFFCFHLKKLKNNFNWWMINIVT